MTKIYPKHPPFPETVNATSNWGPTELCKKITHLISKLFTLIISPFYQLSLSNSAPAMGARVVSNTPCPNDLFLDFYRKIGCNSDGRTFEEILNWDDAQLERDHFFMQWLFPTLVPSKHNPISPVLTEQALHAFQNDLVLVGNLQDAFARMLRFYGLWFDSSRGSIQRAPHFGLRQRVWLTPNNHNFMRIARILNCLNAIGLDHELEMFKQILESIAAHEGKEIIPLDTLKIWRHAAL
ncbi:MAG: hypothetical protein K2P51_06235 [Rhabdochlamydiaceae bacterium]|nr:hypothetical protein [Rhabdochlamydiaceae bacterium]